MFRLDGVAVLSGIPGSDLVLASIAGETLSVRDEQGKMTATSAQLNTRNIFFVFQPSGKAITLKLYPENDKELKRIFVETENPLPTARLLDVLNATAVRDFATEDLPVLVQSSRKQREAIEKEFEAVSLREAAAKSR
ncbi:MAG TPA: hypothetical protein ENJ80_08160 [Gammaproteobacteria bacterium]|nr:hypothetical protein [Gammaproteobacteria bacterium]